MRQSSIKQLKKRFSSMRKDTMSTMIILLQQYKENLQQLVNTNKLGTVIFIYLLLIYQDGAKRKLYI